MTHSRVIQISVVKYNPMRKIVDCAYILGNHDNSSPVVTEKRPKRYNPNDRSAWIEYLRERYKAEGGWLRNEDVPTQEYKTEWTQWV